MTGHGDAQGQGRVRVANLKHGIPHDRSVKASVIALLSVGLLTGLTYLSLTSVARAASGWLSPTTLFTSSSTDPADVAIDSSGDTFAVWARSNGTDTIVEFAYRPAGGEFSPPVALSAAGENATCPTAAMDSNGDATVAWLESNGTNEIVQSAYGQAGGPFSAPVNLSAAGADATCPEVVASSEGGATVAWTRADESGSDVEAASRPPGGAFSASVAVSTSTTDEAAQLELAGDAAGDATVVWDDDGASSDVIEAATQTAGGAFGAPISVSDPGDNPQGFSVAYDGIGDPTVLYAEGTSSNPDSYELAAVAVNGGPGDGVIETSSNLILCPEVSVDARGDAVAVWRSFAYGTTGAETVQASTRPGRGSGWTAPSTLDSGTVEPNGQGLSVLLSAGCPAAAIDADGNASAAWETPANAVMASTEPTGGSFQTEAQLSPANEIAGRPRLASDAAGDTAVVWGTGYGATPTPVEGAFQPADGTFGPVQALSPSGAVLSGLAIDPQGDAVASWTNADGSNSDTGITGFENSPPQVGTVTAPAAGQTDSELSFSMVGTSVWSPLTATWAWGDGTPDSIGTSATHAFRTSGTYQVTATVTDQLGNIVRATRLISISSPSVTVTPRSPTPAKQTSGPVGKKVPLASPFAVAAEAKTNKIVALVVSDEASEARISLICETKCGRPGRVLTTGVVHHGRLLVLKIPGPQGLKRGARVELTSRQRLHQARYRTYLVVGAPPLLLLRLLRAGCMAPSGQPIICA